MSTSSERIAALLTQLESLRRHPEVAEDANNTKLDAVIVSVRELVEGRVVPTDAQHRLIALIRDDGYAATFQTLGQYRSAILRAALAGVSVRAEPTDATTPFNGAFPEASAEELLLRKLLWLRHGCAPHGLYGDDGEMQCATCMLDFRRMAPREIERRWFEIGVRAASRVGAAPRPEPSEAVVGAPPWQEALTPIMTANEALRARVALLEAALAPFAEIATLHAGDENEDERPVSLVNVPTGDSWYLNKSKGFLTRGHLRRARAVLGGVHEETL